MSCAWIGAGSCSAAWSRERRAADGWADDEGPLWGGVGDDGADESVCEFRLTLWRSLPRIPTISGGAARGRYRTKSADSEA